MKSIFTLIVSCFLFFTTTTKAQNLVFIFSAPEGEEILKVNEDLHEKSVDFYVKGLNDVDAVSEFVQKMSASRGVKSFTISEELINGQRLGHGVFEGCLSYDFFKGFLTDAGVQDLVINGEPIKTADLHKVWKSKQNEDNPTKPIHDIK